MLQSKTPSLWMCYTKTHWKMFAFGGLLKLIGDLATLVGPISITFIFEYIQRDFHAASSPDFTTIAATITAIGNSSLSHIHNMEPVNEANETNALLSSAVVPSPPTLTPTINENAEIYYPTWTDFVSNGWVMAMVVLCASLIQGTMSQSSTHIVNMIGIRLRSSLQSLVYRKTLLISSSCFFVNTRNADGTPLVHTNDDTRTHHATEDNCASNCDATVGHDEKQSTIGASDAGDCPKESTMIIIDAAIVKDGDTTYIDTGTIANLMSEDALNVMSFFWIAHYVWAIPLKVRTLCHAMDEIYRGHIHIYCTSFRYSNTHMQCVHGNCAKSKLTIFVGIFVVAAQLCGIY